MYLEPLTAEAPSESVAADPEGPSALARLLAGETLSAASAESLFGDLVAGRLSEAGIAAMLVALRIRGEDEAELIGAARALRAADRPFPRPDYSFADCCGTGGDGSFSINLSTAAGLTAAACGLPVAKHGNRSFTSKCGSADVLEALGLTLEIAPERSRQALDEIGFCFLFAPFYHPGLRHAGPVRRALGVRTICNIVGPCVNPAEPDIQLVGVADPTLIDPVAATLSALGVSRALVVHGSGLDEVALHGPTEAVSVTNGSSERLTLSPQGAGLALHPLAALRGGTVEENAERLGALLGGGGSEAERLAVALNAGALLMAAGRAAGHREGTAQALDALRSGAPARLLGDLIDFARG